jgi:hypothetical protein
LSKETSIVRRKLVEVSCAVQSYVHVTRASD